MQIYTGITGDPLKLELLRKYNLGIMISSHPGVSFAAATAEFPLALDNGAFGSWVHGYPFDELTFLKTLSKCRERKYSLNFIVCPDIVAGGTDSLAFSMQWARRLPYSRWALVVQDGMRPSHLSSVHFRLFRCLFVGGTVDWKWKTAESWVNLAHRHGIKCHIGRVSTTEQLRRARDIGADSCDSTVFVRNDSWNVLEEFVNERQLSMELGKRND